MHTYLNQTIILFVLCGSWIGRGATIEYIEKDTDHLPVGYFWCEIFHGRHLSVDYYRGNQKLITEGFRDKDNPLWKFNRFKVDDEIDYPDILNSLKVTIYYQLRIYRG